MAQCLHLYGYISAEYSLLCSPLTARTLSFIQKPAPSRS